MKIRKVLLAIVVIASIASVGRFLFFEYTLLSYPYQWNSGEALSLSHALILLDGESIYTTANAPPLIVEAYGPVHPYLVAPFVAIFGNSLLAPRLLSFLCYFAIMLIIAGAVLNYTSSWPFAMISLGLNTFMLHNWVQILVSRPDVLGALFLLTLLVLHQKYPYHRLAIGIGITLGLLAFFTKVYFACGFGSVVLSYWFIHKDRRAAITYALTTALLLGASFLIFNTITGNLYKIFSFELMRSWVTEFSFNWMFSNIKGLASYYLPLFFLIIYNITKKRFDWCRYGVYLTHLLLCFPIMAFFLLNRGGGFYYWFSVVIVLLIIGCDQLSAEYRDPKSQVIVPVLIMILMVMFIRVGIRDTLKNKLVFPSASLAAKWLPLEEKITRTDGLILNNDLTTILNIRAGRKLFMDGLGYSRNASYLAKHYNFSFPDLNEAVAAKTFAMIINPEEAITAEVAKHYHLTESYTVPDYLGKNWTELNVFVPKETP